MMNKNIDYKRTEEKGYYENKEDKDHKVYVYDITLSKDKFLNHFALMHLGR